jgi:hypothetical protein
VIDVDRVRAWRPRLAGVAEVLHAEWRDHAYPAHTHDTWTLLLVDDGVIGYELERNNHGANPRGVTLLPPYVPHDGHPLSTRGFRKRVVYLDPGVFGESLIGLRWTLRSHRTTGTRAGLPARPRTGPG